MASLQAEIETSKSVAIIGGGAVGVELSADIRTFYPDKAVTLFHSRDRLLNRFGPRLSIEAEKRLSEVGVRVLCNTRPVISEGELLRVGNGQEENFDSVFLCAGQRPNSDLLASLAPRAISRTSGRILVSDGLQVVDGTSGTPLPNVFALGDVAHHSGPLMGRACYFQSAVVATNILSAISERPMLARYIPRMDLEGSISLTLGKGHGVTYLQAVNGREILLPWKQTDPVPSWSSVRRFLGAKYEPSAP